MPYVTVVQLELVATSGGSLPWFSGSESRGAFLSVVGQACEELARTLHGGGRALYALKPLSFRSGYRVVRGEGRSLAEAGVLFEPGARAVLEVSLLDDEVSRRFVSDVLPVATGLVLKGVSFKVDALAVRVVDPREVLERAEGWESGSLDVHFHTPTYFNPLVGDQRYKVLYPDPPHLLASLVASAHALTGASLPKPQELAEHVYVSGLSIRTPRMEASKPAPNGFVGWARITFKPAAPPQVRRLVTGLLRLGELVNVGGNRTAGYGVITVTPRERRAPEEASGAEEE